jgi:primosomal protein N' (replication factor Y) (superfamily II helicase)
MENDLFAAVFVDVALDKLLDYAVPSHVAGVVKPGARVVVPLRNRMCSGTVMELKGEACSKKVLPIHEVKEAVPEDLLQLGLWMSRYYCTPFFKVVKLLLPPSVRRGMEEKSQLFVKGAISRPKMAEVCAKKRGAQAAILEVMLRHESGILLTELLEKANCSRAPLKKLEEEEIVQLTSISIDRSIALETDFFPTKAKVLSHEQEAALRKIIQSLEGNVFESHLLYGVTGSGKTEVYLQAIDKALALGKSAIFLVPEIALTSQTVERLRGRFQEKVAILHHRLSDGERRDTWHKIHEGKLSLVVGPRSAILSPVKRLGLIVVDEEHDGAYKQSDDLPCYHARDVAVMRAKLCSAAVILGSATPSLESYANAEKGKYILSTLTERADKAHLPKVEIVDVRGKKFTLFSERLLSAIQKRLEAGEQTLLFLNRRGFHTAAVCKCCAHVLKCPHCSLGLTFHKGQNHLACHLCGFELPRVPQQCPGCQAEEAFGFKGAGTELVEKSLQAMFPQVRTLRLDADTTRHKGSHDKLFKQFRAGKADVLIGTQMIAKGLHFPNVTLVGVLNTDSALHIPDFRSAEQTFQLITQVAGRSGRSELKGEVILQTRLPDHPTIALASKLDYPAFFKEEIVGRELFYFPPYCHLVKLVFSGKNERATEAYAQEARQILVSRLSSDFQLHLVTACGYAKIKDRFRFQCLIKGAKTGPITEAVAKLKAPSPIHLLVDVDPLSTFF